MLYCRDKADSIDLRMANRAKHLEYAGANPAVKLGGPMFADDGETMIGSLFVLDVDSIETARDFTRNDPYTLAGLWDSVAIHPFRWALPNN